MHHVSCIIYHLSSIIYHLSHIIHHLSSITYHPSSIIYHLSSIIYHPSSIIYHISYINYIHLSSIPIYHLSSTIYIISYVPTFGAVVDGVEPAELTGKQKVWVGRCPHPVRVLSGLDHAASLRALVAERRNLDK